MLTWGSCTLLAPVFLDWALIIEFGTNDVDVIWTIDPDWDSFCALCALHTETEEKDCKIYKTALTSDLQQTFSIHFVTHPDKS